VCVCVCVVRVREISDIYVCVSVCVCTTVGCLWSSVLPQHFNLSHITHYVRCVCVGRVEG